MCYVTLSVVHQCIRVNAMDQLLCQTQRYIAPITLDAILVVVVLDTALLVVCT
jgi:hypothetical protein